MENKEQFDVHEVASTIVTIVENADKDVLLVKIVAYLQHRLDQRLVPRNYNAYMTRKRKAKWLTHMIAENQETEFWKNIVQAIDTTNMPMHYEALNKKREEQKQSHTGITCFYCERNIDAANFGGEIGIYSTQDHVIAKAKFGKSNYENLVNACNECNFLKADMSLRQFIEKLHGMMNNKTQYGTLTIDNYPTIIKNANQLLILNS